MLLRLVVQIAQLMSEDDGSVKSLKVFGIDWQVVAIALLMEVTGSVRLSHGKNSQFKAEVDEFAHSLGLRGTEVAAEVFEVEKGKLRRVADGGFE